MSGSAVPASVWLKNFTKTAQVLIKEQKENGYTVQGFIFTIGIYDKLADALGYEPTDFLGYVIEILEQTEEDFQKEGEMVFIKGKPIN